MREKKMKMKKDGSCGAVCVCGSSFVYELLISLPAERFYENVGGRKAPPGGGGGGG